MKNTNNKYKKALSLFLFVFIICVLPFSSAVKDLDSKPDKIDIIHEKYGGNILFKDFNKYKASNVEVNSDIKNTIDISSSTINLNYVSVKDYKKNKDNSDYEISFYTGNDGIEYTLYKSDLVDISPKKVKDTATIKLNVFSKDGYVYYNTSGFSTLYLSMPDFTLPFYNTASLDLRNYFGDDVDHYEVLYFDPLYEFTNGTSRLVKLDEGLSSLNTDTFELNLYRAGGLAYLDNYVYDTICNSQISNISEDCFYLEQDIADSNFVFVYGCGNDETVVLTGADTYTNNCSQYDSYRLNTETPYNYYLSDKNGLHNYIDYYSDFNYNQHLTDGHTYDRMHTSTPFNILNATYTTNEGVINNSYYFDGVNDAIDTNQQPSVLNGFSINIWFKTNDIGGGQQLACQWGSDGSWKIVMSQTGDGTGNLRFATFNGAEYSIVTSSSYNDGEWHMATLVFDGTSGSGTLHAYVDGIEEGTGISAEIKTYATDVLLGVNNVGSERYNGLLDEFGIFTKALTNTEISYLYNSGFGKYFHELNHPTVLMYGICSDAVGGTWCASGINRHQIGAFQTGTTTIYLSNYFNYPIGLTESFNVTVYNFDTSSLETIQSGYCTAYGEIYDVCLGGDQLNYTYYGDSQENIFEGSIVAYNNLGYSDTLIFEVAMQPVEVGPPNQTAPLPILTYNISETNDTNQININSYFFNYDTLNITYTDGTPINLYLERGDTSTVCNEGAIRVCLDGGDVSNNIIVNISEIDGNYFDNRLTFHIGNTNSTITDFIDILITPPFTYNFFNKTLSINDSYTYIFDDECHNDSDNVCRNFDNINNIEISFTGEGLKENDTTTYYLNTSSIVGTDCALSLVGIIPGSLQWLSIATFCSDYNSVYWLFNETDENYIFMILTNNYLESGKYGLTIVSGSDNITYKDFNMVITDAYGTYSGKFYLSVDASAPPLYDTITPTDYDSLKDLFMVEDNNHKGLYALIFIAVFVLLSVLFFGKPLNFNGLSLLLMFLFSMIGVFIMCWVDYIEWKYFIVPLIIGVIYASTRIFGGGR